LQPVPQCTCKECDDPQFWEADETEPRRFDCDGCKREVPWCFGADDESPMGDEMFDYCDSCAVAIINFQSEVMTLAR
jgi:hypothetical protein